MQRPINVSDLHTPQGQARLAHYLKDIYTKVIPIIQGSGVPTVIPQQIGQEYLDTTNNKVYKSFGLTVSSWVVIN